MDSNVRRDFTLMPNIQDVMEAIKATKSNKSPGIDSITSEMFKSAGETATKVLHKIITSIWTGRHKVPEDWATGIINPLPKKGDLTKCQNYRAITLLSTAYKITSHIVRKKLENIYDSIMGQYQCGFRRGKSTINQLFTVRHTLEKFWEFNISSYHLFIDFKTAYDSLDRNELWVALRELEIPSELVDVCKTLTIGSKAKIKVNGKLSDEIDIGRGVKQGDGLAPMLFNLALEAAIRRAGINRSATLISQSYQIFGYADDLDIAGRSIKAVKETFESIERQARRLGLIVNEEKTKFMVISRDKRAQNRVGRVLEIGAYKFDVVNEFTYLGSSLTSDNNESTEIKKRIVKANKAYFSLSPILKSKIVTRETKKTIYKTLIRPIVTYGAECWTMKEADIKILECFERKILRRFFGPKRIGGGEFRRRTNAEVYELYEDVDITAFAKISRLRWLGHINRMEENDPCKRILFSTIGNKRPKGRPRNRWWNSVQEDLNKLEIRNWRTVSLDRAAWRQILAEAKVLLRTVAP